MRITTSFRRVYGLTLLLSAACLLPGCASAQKARVVELENGRTAAIATGKSQPDAVIAAVDGANNYCENSKKKPIFRDDLAGNAEEKGGSKLDLAKLPMIGKAFSENEPKVVVAFRCK